MIQTLYQKDSLDRVRSWEIAVINNGENTETIITTGLVDGAKVSNYTTITNGKNIGKSNETTHYEQALLEANSKIELQLKRGYVKDLANIKDKDVLGSGIPAPMLANKHHPTGAQKSSKTLAQLRIIGKQICVQPKLDGNRCLIKVEDGIGTMYSRSGDIMPVQLGHILDDVSGICDKYNIGESFILDGELYSNKISFNKLNGLIKRETASSSDVEERRDIKYHLYDVMLNAGYEKRYEFINKFNSTNIFVIPNYFITATDENIKNYLEQFLSEGHEGLMIRQLGIPYEHKRTWQLCKVKVFEDKEFKLVGFEEDKRGGFVGAFVMENNSGVTFNAGASGQSEEDRTYMWNNKYEFLGKMATVCFFGKSEYGIPRFPKFKGLR
jgi:ATP-dependent DNA ligase